MLFILSFVSPFLWFIFGLWRLFFCVVGVDGRFMYGRFLEAPIKKIRLELHEKLLFPFKLWERTSFLALPHTSNLNIVICGYSQLWSCSTLYGLYFNSTTIILEFFVVGIGKCILRIDATKSGKGRSVFGWGTSQNALLIRWLMGPSWLVIFWFYNFKSSCWCLLYNFFYQLI